jgi:hypothetical protein
LQSCKHGMHGGGLGLGGVMARKRIDNST